jgi:hypothetical protein
MRAGSAGGTEAASYRIAKSGRRVTSGDRLGSVATAPTCQSTTPESRIATQKYRDEVENNRKPGGVRVTARICVGDFPSSASQDELRQPRSTRDEAASICKVEAESPEPVRGLGGFDLVVLAQPKLAVSGARLALMETPDERPIWVNGTLPGTMAGRRPAPRPSRSN